MPSKDEQEKLGVFDTISSKLVMLRNNLQGQEINSNFVEKHFEQIHSSYLLAFNEAFKPKGATHQADQRLISSAFFKQEKVENFTFNFLSGLHDYFKSNLSKAIADYANKSISKQDLLTELAHFQKFVAVIIDIYRGKISLGIDYITSFNHMLLTINDTSLITTLIADHSLGTKGSTVQTYLNNHDLDLDIKNAIIALDDTLQNRSSNYIQHDASFTAKR